MEILRRGISDYLEGNYERPIGKRWRRDGKPSKHDECIHGKYLWEECEACIDRHFTHVLFRYDECRRAGV